MEVDLMRISELIILQKYVWQSIHTRPLPKSYWHLVAGVHFPPWSHANNNRQWGITLSQHTVPTWLLVISVRGTHINDTNTSPVLKQWKVLRNSQQNTANGNLAHWEPHSTGTDQVRVWTEAPFFFHTPAGGALWDQRADYQSFLAWNV